MPRIVAMLPGRTLIGAGPALILVLALATGVPAQTAQTFIAELAPAGPTAAGAAPSGRITLRLNAADETLSYELRLAGIERVVGSHFHSVRWRTTADGARIAVDPAEGEGPIVAFFLRFKSGGVPGDGVVSTGTIAKAELIGDFSRRPFADLIEHLEKGYLYATVHSLETRNGGVYCCPVALRGFFRSAGGS
ncbi:MAG: CHRD domain-containing protein [Rhodospirillales bacterium]|nr:MAG: CHRD domain-containing protein [Rhodospirillales bacterium]